MLFYFLGCLTLPLLWGVIAASFIESRDRKAAAKALQQQPSPEMYEI